MLVPCLSPPLTSPHFTVNTIAINTQLCSNSHLPPGYLFSVVPFQLGLLCWDLCSHVCLLLDEYRAGWMRLNWPTLCCPDDADLQTATPTWPEIKYSLKAGCLCSGQINKSALLLFSLNKQTNIDQPSFIFIVYNNDQLTIHITYHITPDYTIQLIHIIVLYII